MKKKAKVYMLMGAEPYENGYCFGVYINRENAEKALQRINNKQFYDKLNKDNYYEDNMSYWIREQEIKDLLDEKET